MELIQEVLHRLCLAPPLVRTVDASFFIRKRAIE